MKTITTFFLLVLMIQSICAQTYGDYNVRINVEGNGFAHFGAVYFDDESWDPQAAPTYGWDPCCDVNMNLGNARQPHVFTKVVAPPLPLNNQRIALNALPLLFEPIDVTMGFLPGELAQYTFTFGELSTLPPGVTLELEDVAQNVTQDLLANNTYTTWGAVSDPEDRFILHFNLSNITGIDGQGAGGEPNIYVESEKLIIVGEYAEKIETVEIISIDGKLISRVKNLNQENKVSLDITEMNPGIYVVRIAHDSGRITSTKARI